MNDCTCHRRIRLAGDTLAAFAAGPTQTHFPAKASHVIHIFAAGAPAPLFPLSGWQEYAHALLLTNEAAFVN